MASFVCSSVIKLSKSLSQSDSNSTAETPRGIRAASLTTWSFGRIDHKGQIPSSRGFVHDSDLCCGLHLCDNLLRDTWQSPSVLRACTTGF